MDPAWRCWAPDSSFCLFHIDILLFTSNPSFLLLLEIISIIFSSSFIKPIPKKIEEIAVNSYRNNLICSEIKKAVFDRKRKSIWRFSKIKSVDSLGVPYLLFVLWHTNKVYNRFYDGLSLNVEPWVSLYFWKASHLNGRHFTALPSVPAERLSGIWCQ